MLDAKLKDMKKHGEQNVKHKPVSLSVKTCSVWKRAPLSFLHNVWFHVSLYFNSVDVVRKSSLLFLQDENSEWYATMGHDEASKTRRGGIDVPATNYKKLGRMYQKAIWKSSAKRLVYINHCLRATAITLWSDAGLLKKKDACCQATGMKIPFATAPNVSHLPWIHKPIRKFFSGNQQKPQQSRSAACAMIPNDSKPAKPH